MDPREQHNSLQVIEKMVGAIGFEPMTSTVVKLSGRIGESSKLSTVGQLTALHQLGPNDVPADAEQPRRLNLVAMTEFIRCPRDRRLDLGVKVGTAIFKNCQERVMQRFEGLNSTSGRDSEPKRGKPQIFRSDHIFAANQEGVMDDIFQFSRIAWPRVPTDEDVNRRRAQRGLFQSQALPI